MTKARDLSKSTLPDQSGNSGKFLTTDGTLQSWGTASSTPSYTLINTGGTALTGATGITVNGISGKNNLLIRITAGSSNNSTPSYYLRFNSDTSNSYTWAGLKTTTDATYAIETATTSPNTELMFGRGGGGEVTEIYALIHVYGANSSGIKPMSVNSGAYYYNGKESYATQGFYSGTSTISSVTVYTTGNWDAGTIYVYGA